MTENIAKHKGNSKALFKIVNSCLNRKQESPLPYHENEETLANEFCTFFDQKIKGIREKLDLNSASTSPSTTYTRTQKYVGPKLANFDKLSESEIKKLVKSMAVKHCSLDPIHTWIIIKCIDTFVPILTKIVNLSLKLGHVPKNTKHAIIKPLLKKPEATLSPKNYRPVSNLTFLGKLIESAVIHQFNRHSKKLLGR